MNILLAATDGPDSVSNFVPHAFFIAGVIFITAYLVIRIRKRGQRNLDQPTARETLERYKTRDAVRGDLEGLMVDIEELARRLGAQLDAKARNLETLLAQADQRIAKLSGEAAPSADPVDRFEPRVPMPTPEPAACPVEPSPMAEGTAKPPAPSPPGPDPSADPAVNQVYRLADAGQSASGIADELDEPIGKVELILALRQT